MLTPLKRHQLDALQAKLGSLFDMVNSSKWIDEIRLTTKEAALFLGITPNALRIRVHRGDVEAEKNGNELRFKISSLLNTYKKLEV